MRIVVMPTLQKAKYPDKAWFIKLKLTIWNDVNF